MMRRTESRALSRDWQRRLGWLGGFNLLPYRARETRRLRQRMLGEISVAALLGLVGLALWSAGRALESARLDAQRRHAEQRLVTWAPQVREAERIARALDAERRSYAQALEYALPRQRLVELFDVLQRLRYDGVRLQTIRQDEHGALLQVSALDHSVVGVWLLELNAVRRDWSLEVTGLQSDQAPFLRASEGHRVAVAVRIRWPDSPRHDVVDVGDTDDVDGSGGAGAGGPSGSGGSSAGMSPGKQEGT